MIRIPSGTVYCCCVQVLVFVSMQKEQKLSDILLKGIGEGTVVVLQGGAWCPVRLQHVGVSTRL